MSNMHPTWLLPIEEYGAGLVLMPCPGTKDVSLEETIDQLAEHGVNGVLSVLSSDEMKILDVEQMPSVCEKKGMAWFQLNVPNGELPNDEAFNHWSAYKNNIKDVLTNGGTMAVHCKGGTSRTGLGAAMMLRVLGWSADKAITEVKVLRPGAFRKPEHVEYIEQMAI